MSDIQTDSIKLPDHSQPSDYSDVQPKSYDPEFISQISSKMQVPDRISVGSDYESRSEFESREAKQHDYGEVSSFVRMTVPDRIVLAVDEENSQKDIATPNDNTWSEDPQTSYTVMEIPYTLVVGGQDRPSQSDNQHIGLRQDMDMDLPANTHKNLDMSYVGLITPPRTLTLEERFPVVESNDNQKLLDGHRGASKHNIVANGHVVGPVPYDPGVNLNESVLLNEENEATLLRTQVAKLTRRVQVIEQDNQRRASRELVMYPMILGYFLWKLLGWLTRDR